MPKKMGKFVIDGDAVKQLAEILAATDLTEIEYEDNGSRIYVSRNVQSVPSYVAAAPTAPIAIAPVAAASAPVAVDFSKHLGAVKSPMVGTAYLAPEPGVPPFVKVGDTVTEGQTLLIVEAMKVMNPIKSHKSGTVSHILVSDARPVEYDEPLVIIE